MLAYSSIPQVACLDSVLEACCVMDKLPSDISEANQSLHQLLLDIDQGHLFADWPAGDAKREAKEQFFEQIAVLEKVYPGGLRAYHRNAKQLLAESRDGVNPFEGYVPSVPDGETIVFDDTERFEVCMPVLPLGPPLPSFKL